MGVAWLVGRVFFETASSGGGTLLTGMGFDDDEARTTVSGFRGEALLVTPGLEGE